MKTYKNQLIGFSMKRLRVITISFFIGFLILFNIFLLLENIEFKSKISNNKKYVISSSTYHLSKDYVLPVLYNEHFELRELYEISAYIDATYRYVVYFLNYNPPQINTYLADTKKEIHVLIDLIESSADITLINEQIDKLISLQEDIIKKYEVN